MLLEVSIFNVADIVLAPCRRVKFQNQLEAASKNRFSTTEAQRYREKTQKAVAPILIVLCVSVVIPFSDAFQWCMVNREWRMLRRSSVRLHPIHETAPRAASSASLTARRSIPA